MNGDERDQAALSEAQLRAILDATPFPVALVDVEDDVIEFWSRSAHALFGHTAPTAPEWYELAYPDPDYRRAVIERWKPALKEARLSGQAVNAGEYRVTCRDGSVRICELYASFVADKLVVTFHDITERRRTEVALRESEGRYRSVVEHAAEAIYVVQDGRIAFANRVGIEMFGYGEKEIASRPFVEFIHPEDRAMVGERHLRRLAGERLESRYSFRVTTKRGEVRWVEIGAAAITYDERPATVNLIVDITERMRTQSALEESKRFNESILRTIPLPMDVVDEAGRILFMNDKLQGLAGGQALGEPCWTRFKDDKEQCEGCAIKREVGIGETRVVEVSGVFGGRTVEIVHTGMVFQGRRAVMEIFNDITDKRQLQARLAQSDRLSTMGMLAAGVAHEINNPLSYVLYNVESLAHDLPKLVGAAKRCFLALQDRVGTEAIADIVGVDAEVLQPATMNDAADRAREAVAGGLRIKEIARGLGTFSRVEQVERTRVDLNYTIACAVSMAKNELKYRARVVEDYGQVPRVVASEGKLSQVFLNLLINAAHAIDEGHVEANRIGVRTWREGGAVLAEVTDTGRGILRENLTRIFEPFFSTKPVGVGSGLGLAICRNIITELGGELSVESEVGKGTRFVVRLPTPPEVVQARAMEAASDSPPVSQGRGRILVVDDEEDIRKMLCRMLGREHELVTLASGEEACALLDEDRAFDVVLCDLMMPRMSGMELHAWIVARDPSLAGRVVFLTGGAFTPRALAYLGSVKNLRIDKPVDPVALRAIVKAQVLEHRASRYAK
jgi:two-component system, cell cycle sensor histidine kinase and response regulator CckA